MIFPGEGSEHGYTNVMGGIEIDGGGDEIVLMGVVMFFVGVLSRFVGTRLMLIYSEAK